MGSSALLRFRLFGFPISVHTSYLVIIGVLGLVPGQSLDRWLVWMGVASLAVLLHELGHAVAARLWGAEPEIALIALGGVTTFSLAGRAARSRGVSIAISAAGPGVGLVLGAGLIALDRAVALPRDGVMGAVVDYGIFTTLAWSVLNLLPALPLDGGHILQELLPGDPDQRLRRAAAVSIGVTVIAAVAAVTSGWTVFGVFAALLVFTNIMTLREGRSGAADGGPGAAGAAGPVDTGRWGEFGTLVLDGKHAEARAVLEEASQLRAAEGGPPVDLAIHGLVMAIGEEREQGFALILQELQRRPGDVAPVRALAMAHIALGEYDRFGALMTGAYGRAVEPFLVRRAQQKASGTGADDVAARLGETYLADLPPVPENEPAHVRGSVASIALHAAAARARRGEDDAALADLHEAFERGLRRVTMIRSDPSFARLEGDPRFTALLERFPQRGIA